MKKNKLFLIPKPLKSPRLRLFCFPYAGGSPSTFISWVKLLDDDIELVLIQSPGRGARIFESPYDEMSGMIDELLEYADFITRTPYVVFGHSLGSRVAYELVYALQERHFTLPRLFIGSGSRAPFIVSSKESIHHLEDKEFIAELGKLNGTSPEVLANTELIEILLPVLRADFKIADCHVAKKQPLNTPMLILYGTDDESVSMDDTQAWQELSTSAVRVIQISGDHFFVDQKPEQVVHEIKNTLSAIRL